MDQTFFGEKNPTVICKKSNGYLGILKKSNGKNPTVAESKKKTMLPMIVSNKKEVPPPLGPGNSAVLESHRNCSNPPSDCTIPSNSWYYSVTMGFE